MNRDLRDRWIAALRSGKYGQATHYLRHGDKGFCCLGVLCDVASAEWRTDSDEDGGVTVIINGVKVNNDGELNDAGRDLFGLTYGNANDLMGMNDGSGFFLRHTFAEIAEHIERTL